MESYFYSAKPKGKTIHLLFWYLSVLAKAFPVPLILLIYKKNLDMGKQITHNENNSQHKFYSSWKELKMERQTYIMDQALVYLHQFYTWV